MVCAGHASDAIEKVGRLRGMETGVDGWIDGWMGAMHSTHCTVTLGFCVSVSVWPQVLHAWSMQVWKCFGKDVKITLPDLQLILQAIVNLLLRQVCLAIELWIVRVADCLHDAAFVSNLGRALRCPLR